MSCGYCVGGPKDGERVPIYPGQEGKPSIWSYIPRDRARFPFPDGETLEPEGWYQAIYAPTQERRGEDLVYRFTRWQTPSETEERCRERMRAEGRGEK